jgi:hypothetical protein
MGFIRPREELERLRPAWRVLIAACAQNPVDIDAYRSATKAIEALNDLAEAISRDRDLCQKPGP